MSLLRTQDNMRAKIEKILRPLLRFLERRYKVFLFAVTLSLFLAVYFISKLEIKSGFEDLLPQNNIAVQMLKKIPEKVGGAKYVKIAVTTKDVDAAKRFADAYVAALKEYPEIQYIRHRFDNRFFRRHFLQYLDDKELENIRDKIAARTKYEKERNNPFYFSLEEQEPPPLEFLDIEKRYEKKAEFKEQGYYVTKEGEVLFILARPRGFASNIAYAKKLLKEMHAIAKRVDPAKYHPSIEVHLLGAYSSNLTEYRALIMDVASTALLSLTLLLLLFYLYFRKVRALLFITVAPVVGVIWTFAATYFMIGHINTQTAFLAAILLGLVVDFSIHLASRFYEERQAGNAAYDALLKSLSSTGIAVMFSGVTTILAFIALVFSDFVGFWQFGLIASVGVAICILANFTIFPALVFLLEKDANDTQVLPITARSLFTLFANVVDRVHPTRRVQKAVVYVSILLAVAAAASAPFIQFEYNLRNLRSTAFTNEKLTNRLEEVMGRGTTPSAIFLTDGLEEVREVDAVLAKLETNRDTTIREYRSVNNFVPKNVEYKKELFAEIRKLVDEGEKYLRLANKSSTSIEDFREYLDVPFATLEDVPEDFLVEFRDTEGKLGSFVLVYPKSEQTQMKQMMRHAKEIREIKAASGRTYYASGESIIFSDMLALMKTDGRNAIILAFVLIFLVVLLQTRRLRHSLVLLAPLYVGTLFICGFMVCFSIKLNFFNIIIFPMIIGIGVDNCIHLFARFVELGYRDVRTVVRSVGRAVLMTSLTTVIGFSSLLYAKSMALNSMGLLAVVGIGFCWLTSVTLLPAMMNIFYDDRQSGATHRRKDLAEDSSKEATTIPANPPTTHTA